MSRSLASRWVRPLSAASLLLAVAGCAATSVTDHSPSGAASAGAAVIRSGQLGRTLLVTDMALPAHVEARAEREAEARAVAARTIATLTSREVVAAERLLGEAAGGDEARVLAAARANGFDNVIFLRIEDYQRNGELLVAVAVPPVAWKTETAISLRFRVLEAADGTVLADIRRDRVNGGFFALRKVEDLPAELDLALRSLVAA